MSPKSEGYHNDGTDLVAYSAIRPGWIRSEAEGRTPAPRGRWLGKRIHPTGFSVEEWYERNMPSCNRLLNDSNMPMAAGRCTR
jgi:hypothetical protein